MKSKLNYALVFITLIFLSSCGGSQLKNNKYLGELPSMAAKFDKKLDALEKEMKETTDMEEAFKLDKEYKQLKEKAKDELKLYVESFEFPPIPFTDLESNPFTIEDLQVNNTSKSRVNLKGKVKIEEDLKNKYGGFEKSFFAYIKAVDANGEMLGKPTVMVSDMGNRDPFTAGSEVEIFGSIGPLSQFESFDQIVFISKEEYQENK